MSMSKVELGTILTGIGMLIAATVYLTEIRVGLGSAQDRIASLERGSLLADQKEAALTEIRNTVESMPATTVPVGSILAWYGDPSNVPEGYLLCDGSQITKTNYPALYQHLIETNQQLKSTNEIARLPNLSGQFLRGNATNINVGQRGGAESYVTTNNGSHQHNRQEITPSRWFGDDNDDNGYRNGPDGNHNHSVKTVPPFVGVSYIIKS